jgi:hypothetical protein
MEERNKGLIVFGIILLAVGLVASFYQKTQHVYGVGDQIITPYMNVGIVLIVAAIIFLALGFLYSPRKALPPPPPSNP